MNMEIAALVQSCAREKVSRLSIKKYQELALTRLNEAKISKNHHFIIHDLLFNSFAC